MTLYMAVTPDKYELPLAVEAHAEDIAEIFGTTAKTVYSSISKGRSGKRNGVKFVKVKVYV